MNHHQQVDQDRRSYSRSRWIFIGFLLIAAYFLITEHRAHLGDVLNYLPILLLLACPFMHMFMHHGHRGGEAHGASNDGREMRK